MTRLALPLCLLAILAPLGAGLLVARVRDLRAARALAAVAATLVFGLMIALLFLARSADASGYLVDPWQLSLGGSARPVLGVDSLSAPVMALISLISVITVVAWPRHMTTQRSLNSLLVTHGLVNGLLTSMNLGVFTIFWMASTVPGMLEARSARSADGASRPRRAWVILLIATALPLFAATSVLLWARLSAGADAPLHLPDLVAEGLTGRPGLAVGMLMGLAVFTRSALVPVHGWVSQSFEHGPSGTLLLFWATQPGAYLMARVLLPLFSSVSMGVPVRPLLALLGLFTAVYAALLGLAQTDLKRVVGFLAVSYGGIVLVGLASTHVDGIGGGLVLWLSLGLTMTGLAMTTVAVESRTGTTDIRRLGGLSRSLPRLTACFLIFGMAAVGLPGMLGFVAEDLLVHGVVESYPWIAAALLVATVLNGINVMRTYTRVFVGEPPASAVRVPRGREMRRRERLAAVALVGLLLALGLAPQSIVSLRADAAVDLSQHAHTTGAHPAPHTP
jgi:NADH-quinone oxidoreductase subunit M